MHILVHKDSATKVPKEVLTLDEALAIEASGFTVEMLNEDGTYGPLPEAEAEAEADEAEEVDEVEDEQPPAAKKAPAKKVAAKKTRR